MAALDQVDNGAKASAEELKAKCLSQKEELLLIAQKVQRIKADSYYDTANQYHDNFLKTKEALAIACELLAAVM